MNLSVAVSFDKKFGYYRARFRGPGYDRKEKVPTEMFELRGVDHTTPSRQAETIATEWAADRKREMEGRPRESSIAHPGARLSAIFALYKRRNPNGSQPITIAKNEALMNNLLSYEPLANADPAEIDSGLALDYFERRTKDGLSPRSVANELRFLIHILGLAYEWQRETGVTNIRFAKLPKRVSVAVKARPHKGRALTMDEFFAVLEQRSSRNVITRRFRKAVIIGATTGIRRSNLLAIRWTWITKKPGYLTIPADQMKGKGGAKRPLVIPLSRWAAEAIGPRMNASEYVFGSKMWRFDLTLRTLAKKAKVEPFTLHDLRRTFATWLANEKVELRVISALLGHSARVNRAGELLIGSDSVAEAAYIFVSPVEMQTAINLLDARLDTVFAGKRGKLEIRENDELPEVAQLVRR